MYEYQATVLSVHDGDTIHVDIDLGFEIRQTHTLRFAGINAPELATPEGKDVAAWVTAQLPVGLVVTLRTAKDRAEKYGRYLAWVMMADGSCLNQTMVDTGRAVPFGDLPASPPGSAPPANAPVKKRRRKLRG